MAADPVRFVDRFHARPEAVGRYDEVSQGPIDLQETKCVYRLGVAAVDVDGFPSGAQIGPVKVFLIPGPVRTQRTEVQQRKPPPLVFDKRMERVEVGRGRMLLMCEIEASLGSNVAARMSDWHQACQTAVGLLAAVLDDRLAGDTLLEDVLILDPCGTHMGTIDRIAYVRDFFPREITSVDAANIVRLGGLELQSGESGSGLATAARYYLKGVSERLPDSIVYFWTALEALAQPGEKPVRAVERLIREAGLREPEGDDVSVGRLYGLRGQVVHRAENQDPLLEKGHLFLEALLRGLLRHRTGMRLMETSWPLLANQPRIEADGRPIPGDWVAAQTVWHDDLPPAGEE